MVHRANRDINQYIFTDIEHTQLPAKLLDYFWTISYQITKTTWINYLVYCAKEPDTCSERSQSIQPHSLPCVHTRAKVHDCQYAKEPCTFRKRAVKIPQISHLHSTKAHRLHQVKEPCSMLQPCSMRKTCLVHAMSLSLTQTHTRLVYAMSLSLSHTHALYMPWLAAHWAKESPLLNTRTVVHGA